LLGGIGVGSALAYLFDPAQGRMRRARTRDKAVHAMHEGPRGAERLRSMVTNRARGLACRVRAALIPAPASDEVIKERARAAIGRVCSHAHALDVSVVDGEVVISGPIIEREHARVLRDVSRVRGVRAVHDQLARHVHPGKIPGLQGGRARGAAPSNGHRTRCAEVMKSDVRTVGEGDSVSRAADLMAVANVGFLPVIDSQRRVVGTLTDRDIVVRVVAQGRLSAECRVGEVMSRDVVSCRPDDDLALAEALMAQCQISRLAITDEEGTLAGIISLSDVAKRAPAGRAGATLRAVAAREVQRPS
jgi:CBS domain-containing protein